MFIRKPYTVKPENPAQPRIPRPMLERGGSSLDAVEAAINQVELRSDVADVGYGGNPNAVGETTLDAMILWGPTHDVGAVGCLKRIRRAVSVARAVMERKRAPSRCSSVPCSSHTARRPWHRRRSHR